MLELQFVDTWTPSYPGRPQAWRTGLSTCIKQPAHSWPRLSWLAH